MKVATATAPIMIEVEWNDYDDHKLKVDLS